MIPLVNKDTVQSCIREFKVRYLFTKWSVLTCQHYTRDPEDAVAEAAIKAIGHCVRSQVEVAATGLSALMKLLNSQRGVLKRVLPLNCRHYRRFGRDCAQVGHTVSTHAHFDQHQLTAGSATARRTFGERLRWDHKFEGSSQRVLVGRAVRRGSG